MRRLSFLPLLVISLILSHAIPRRPSAEIDTRRLSLSSQYADPVAWLNIEGPPFWVGGIEPHYSFDDRTHIVELEPGNEVRLILPTGDSVLVQGPAEELDMLEWSTSNGSGLWSEAVAETTAIPDQMLFPFSMWGTRLVAIRHSGAAEHPIRIALFVSRRDGGVKIRFERKSIPLDSVRRTLALGLQPQAGPLYELEPGEERTVEIDGPHRYLLEHRVFYPHEVSDRRFSYRVELRTGERTSESEFVAYPEVRNFSTVTARTRVVGRLMRSYIDVPAGPQRLTIRTDAPLLARLLGPFDELRASWADDAEATVEGSAWLAEWSTLESDALSDPRSNAHQRALLRIARDNRQIDAGLLAADRAIAEARAMPNLRSLRRFAKTLAIGQIGYRGLLARRGENPNSEESRSYLFITSNLRSPVDDRDRYVLGDQHATSLRRQTVSGRFVPLPEAKDELVYFLPERSVASRLRLALQPRGRAGDSCRLTIDLGADRHVRLHTGTTPAPKLLDVGAPAVATSLQTASGDIPGAVASLGWSSESSSAEFELPESTDVVRVRSTDCDGRRVALAYGVGRRDSMNEAEYRAAVSALGGPPAATRLFSAALENLDDLLDGSAPLATTVGDAAGESNWQRAASARLLNHWIPSLRMIRARSVDFRHRVEAIVLTPTERNEFDDLQELRARAEELERAGHWLAAYEMWMKIALAGPSDTASEVKLRAVDALLRSGESRLAATILKAEMIHGRDEALVSQALDRLAEIYHRQGNALALEGLLASRAISARDEARSDALARLSSLALEQGNGALALRLDLILPATHYNPVRRTEAAYLKRWWTTFEESLDEHETSTASRWKGYRAQQAGDFGEARRQWRDADDAGKSALVALDRALSIRDDLVDGSPEERNQALQRWAGWRRSLPGRRVWKSAEDLVVSEDGGERLRSKSLGLFSRWARSTPDRPVRIRVVGPTTLRVDTRPLVTPSSPRNESSWLTFRTGRRHWRSPIRGASISTGIERSDDGPESIGSLSRSTLVLDPGIHEIEIFDPRGASLLRVFEEKPQFDFAILPNLSPGALDWLEGNAPPPATSGIGCRSVGRLNVCSRPLFAIPEITESSFVVADLQAAFNPRLFLEPGPDGIDAAWPRLVPAAELPPAEARIEEEFRPALGPEEVIRDSWLISERNRQPYGRMTRIGALADLSRTDPLIQSLYDKAMSSFRWKRVTKVVESAGVRLVPQPLGAPFTRGSRKSWPLLSPSCRHSDRLRESAEIVVALDNRMPTTISVEIEDCHRSAETARSATALIEVDGDSRNEVRLGESQHTATVNLAIAAGSHSIRVSAPSVPTGHTIGVRVLEHGRPINPTRNRAYHVARPESPLVLEIAGPTRIRIDQLHEGVTRTAYRSLPPGDSLIELTSEGNPDMLYRVVKTVRRNDEISPRAPTPPRLAAVHTPLAIASLDGADPEPAKMHPGRIRAGLEDGTWTATVKYLSRRSDNDEPGSKFSEDMGELRGTHRFRNESWGFYSQGDLFARPRKNGGPTFGGRGRWIWPTLGIWRGLERRATVTTVVQPPTDGPNRLEALLGANLEAALPHSMTAKIRHRPAIGLFARWLSLGDRNGYPRENIDRDVFTPYKADHLYGLTLKDSLTIRPYRDVFGKLDIGIQTNEDFNIGSPDRVSMGLAAAVLYQGLEIDGGYRWRHYFDDSDRSDSIDRYDIFLGVQLERWLRLARRWQLGVEARHEISRSTTSLMLSLSFHFGRERGFRDFAPDTLRFRNERDLSRRRQTDSSRGRDR
jgi:hypothetical protein